MSTDRFVSLLEVLNGLRRGGSFVSLKLSPKKVVVSFIASTDGGVYVFDSFVQFLISAGYDYSFSKRDIYTITIVG